MARLAWQYKRFKHYPMLSLKDRLTLLDLHGFQIFTQEELEKGFDDVKFNRPSKKKLYNVSNMNYGIMNDVVASRNGKTFYGKAVR